MSSFYGPTPGGAGANRSLLAPTYPQQQELQLQHNHQQQQQQQQQQLVTSDAWKKKCLEISAKLMAVEKELSTCRLSFHQANTEIEKIKNEKTHLMNELKMMDAKMRAAVSYVKVFGAEAEENVTKIFSCSDFSQLVDFSMGLMQPTTTAVSGSIADVAVNAVDNESRMMSNETQIDLELIPRVGQIQSISQEGGYPDAPVVERKPLKPTAAAIKERTVPVPKTPISVNQKSSLGNATRAVPMIFNSNLMNEKKVSDQQQHQQQQHSKLKSAAVRVGQALKLQPPAPAPPVRTEPPQIALKSLVKTSRPSSAASNSSASAIARRKSSAPTAASPARSDGTYDLDFVRVVDQRNNKQQQEESGKTLESFLDSINAESFDPKSASATPGKKAHSLLMEDSNDHAEVSQAKNSDNNPSVTATTSPTKTTSKTPRSTKKKSPKASGKKIQGSTPSSVATGTGTAKSPAVPGIEHRLSLGKENPFRPKPVTEDESVTNVRKFINEKWKGSLSYMRKAQREVFFVAIERYLREHHLHDCFYYQDEADRGFMFLNFPGTAKTALYIHLIERIEKGLFDVPEPRKRVLDSIEEMNKKAKVYAMNISPEFAKHRELFLQEISKYDKDYVFNLFPLSTLLRELIDKYDELDKNTRLLIKKAIKSAFKDMLNDRFDRWLLEKDDKFITGLPEELKDHSLRFIKARLEPEFKQLVFLIN